MSLEEVELLARLDAIGGAPQAEPAAHTDGGSDDRRVGLGGRDARQETAIHLDRVDWQHTKRAEG